MIALSWAEIEIPEREDPRQRDRRAPYEMYRDAIPIEDGGIRKGAGFALEDIQYSIAEKSFAPGTVLYDTKRDAYFAITYPCPKVCKGRNWEVDIDALIRMYK